MPGGIVTLTSQPKKEEEFIMSGIPSIGGTAPQAVSGASKRMPMGQMMAQLFQQIDTSNSGSISKEQFNSAFQSMNLPPALKAMGAEAVYNQLDPSGTGSISKQDFISGMRKVMAQARGGRHHHHGEGTDAASGTPPSATSASAIQSFGDILKS